MQFATIGDVVNSLHHHENTSLRECI